MVNSIKTSSTSSTGAKGIKATGDLQISGGTYNLTTTDDSIHSNGSCFNYELLHLLFHQAMVFMLILAVIIDDGTITIIRVIVMKVPTLQ